MLSGQRYSGGLEIHMDFHKIWQEQCEATHAIRERFGVENALDYLVGEKLLNFAKAAEQDPEFAAELPRFQTAVWEIFISRSLTLLSMGTAPSVVNTVSSSHWLSV
jgi:hypothetical protein